MKKSNTQDIGSVLQECFRLFNIEKKLKEIKLINSWESIAGKMVANATTQIYIKNGVLYVFLKSAIIRNELILIREGLINRLNEVAGETLVKGIIIR